MTIMSDARHIDFETRTIPFIEYRLPHGERFLVRTTNDLYTDEVLRKAQDIIDAGFRFEIETLRNDMISMTISDDDGDYAFVMCQNDENVPKSVVELVNGHSVTDLKKIRDSFDDNNEDDENELDF